MREDTGPRPSARAAERLAADVGAEVADLRGSLRRALDEADRLQAVGRTDLAAEVLEDQLEALVAVHQHLADRLAAAAVEREAEHILEAASLPARTDGAEVATPPVWDTTVLRLAASAAAAVAGLALLFAPDLGPGMLEAAGFGSSGETPSAGTSTEVTAPAAEAAVPDGASEAPQATSAPETADASAPVVATHLGGNGDDADTPRAPSPGPQPDPTGLPDVVDEVADDLLTPLVEGAGAEDRADDGTAETSDDEEPDDDPRDASSADVDLDGSSAE